MGKVHMDLVGTSAPYARGLRSTLGDICELPSGTGDTEPRTMETEGSIRGLNEPPCDACYSWSEKVWTARACAGGRCLNIDKRVLDDTPSRVLDLRKKVSKSELSMFPALKGLGKVRYKILEITQLGDPNRRHMEGNLSEVLNEGESYKNKKQKAK